MYVITKVCLNVNFYVFFNTSNAKGKTKKKKKTSKYILFRLMLKLKAGKDGNEIEMKSNFTAK